MVACNNNITKTYNVVFYDWNNTVLSTQDIKEGLNATAPANPSREGYDFIGWDKEFTNVKTIEDDEELQIEMLEKLLKEKRLKMEKQKEEAEM